MGQTVIQIKSIKPENYADVLELSKTAVKELYQQPIVDMTFNFKIKNIFVTPGNITRGIFLDDKLVGVFLCEGKELLYNNNKKLIISFFYVKEEIRNDEYLKDIYDYIEQYALTNNYVGLGFDDQLPFLSSYMSLLDSFEKKSNYFEKML